MLLALDDRDPRPAYLQIAAAIKEQVRGGALRPGEELPSVRELARELGINLHTARHAYQVLGQEGVVHLRLGRRAKVAALRDRPASREEIEARLLGPIHALLTEAFHLGLGPEEFRTLVDTAIDQKQRRPS